MKTSAIENTDPHTLAPSPHIHHTNDARRPSRPKKKPRANSKWNARFHAHFRSVPEDDALLQGKTDMILLITLSRRVLCDSI